MKQWKNTFILIFGFVTFSVQQNSGSNDRTCECIPYYLCHVNGSVIEYGQGIIDIRNGIVGRSEEEECSHYLDVCCQPPDISPNKPGETNKPKDPTKDPLEASPTGKGCGHRNPNGVGFHIIGNYSREAQFGEFPWMTAIFREEEEINGARVNIYTCGGSLIHPKVVLTAAHCVSGIDAKKLMIRAGEWDTQTTKEPLPVQDRSVSSVVIHSKFHHETLANNVALLFLSEPVKYADNVDTICVPDVNDFIISERCVVTGWGQSNLGGNHYQTILKKIDASLLSFKACEHTFRTNSLLGWSFYLDRTSICATENKAVKACKGDGGSPLVCPLRDNPERYTQVGIVSWGSGCEYDLPGVYASVQITRSWIDKQLKLNKIATLSTPSSKAGDSVSAKQFPVYSELKGNSQVLTDTRREAGVTIKDFQYFDSDKVSKSITADKFTQRLGTVAKDSIAGSRISEVFKAVR